MTGEGVSSGGWLRMRKRVSIDSDLNQSIDVFAFEAGAQQETESETHYQPSVIWWYEKNWERD